jgi:hypothetical protein
MKFKLDNLIDWPDEMDYEKYESVGFKFKPVGGGKKKISDSERSIEINTIDDLKNLLDKFPELIISKDEITIYDGYNE